MRRSRRPTSVALPWERRGMRFVDLLARMRWKLLFAAASIASLATFVGRTGEFQRAVDETRASVFSMRRAIAYFRENTGRCPTNATELLRPPAGASPYLEHIPKDAWGRTLFVRCPDPFDPKNAEVVSSGPSGSFLVDDNIL